MKTTRLKAVSPTANPAAKPLPLIQQVLDIIALRGPVRSDHIASEIGKDAAWVRASLDGHIKAGMVLHAEVTRGDGRKVNEYRFGAAVPAADWRTVEPLYLAKLKTQRPLKPAKAEAAPVVPEVARPVPAGAVAAGRDPRLTVPVCAVSIRAEGSVKSPPAPLLQRGEKDSVALPTASASAVGRPAGGGGKDGAHPSPSENPGSVSSDPPPEGHAPQVAAPTPAAAALTAAAGDRRKPAPLDQTANDGSTPLDRIERAIHAARASAPTATTAELQGQTIDLDATARPTLLDRTAAAIMASADLDLDAPAVGISIDNEGALTLVNEVSVIELPLADVARLIQFLGDVEPWVVRLMHEQLDRTAGLHEQIDARR